MEKPESKSVEEKGGRLLPQTVLSGKKESPAKFTHCGFQHWLNAELTSIGVRKEESTYFM